MELNLPPDADADLVHYRRQFEHEHLPDGAPQQLAKVFHENAQMLLDVLGHNPGARVGLSHALHDLWRSKNEAVSTAVHLSSGSGNRPGRGDGGGTVGA